MVKFVKGLQSRGALAKAKVAIAYLNLKEAAGNFRVLTRTASDDSLKGKVISYWLPSYSIIYQFIDVRNSNLEM